jgi:hypothetical protein
MWCVVRFLFWCTQVALLARSLQSRLGEYSHVRRSRLAVFPRFFARCLFFKNTSHHFEVSPNGAVHCTCAAAPERSQSTAEVSRARYRPPFPRAEDTGTGGANSTGASHNFDHSKLESSLQGIIAGALELLE